MNKNQTATSPAGGAYHLKLGATMVALVVMLSACGGDKAEKKPGQALASVNGEEITILQLNEELSRANVPAAQQEAARKRVLESLIDRELLVAEAEKEKLDRDPKVVQAVERAKALIIAQSYLQRRVGNVSRPTKAEVEAYYKENPQFFAERKQFDMRQLVFASSDLSAEAKAAIDSSKSIEEVATWFDAHKVKYARAQLSRSSAELPPQLTQKLAAMPKGQLFIVREGERSLLNAIVDVRDAPATLEQATPQIEQFLFNQKNKAAADAELKRLRSTAKIEYLNQPATPVGTPPTAPAAAAATAPVADRPTDASADANARGVSGLR